MLDHAANAMKASQYIKIKQLIERAKRDPELAAKLKRSNDALVRLKTLTPGQVHNDSTLANLSIQYRNEDFIGIQLMPVITVGKPSDKFFRYDKRNRLATPDDSVSTRSTPNEVAETRSQDNFSTRPYSLLEFVDEKTLQAQDAPLNEMVDAVAAVNDALAFREEKRIASVLTTAANFGAQTTTLSGGAQWSATGTSSPLKDITAARDAVWSGMGGSTRLVGYCGLAVYNAIRQHAETLAAFKHQSGLRLPTRQQLAEYLELDDLLVGKAWEDTVNEGQTATYGRIWGKHFGIVRVASSPSIRTAAFGYTFRFGQPDTNQWFDPKPGVAGGYYVKVGMQEDHKVAAQDAGYFIQNAIA
jgi:hypothetical protein